MPKKVVSNDFKKALEQFTLNNYKMSVADAVHERKIFNKNGSPLKDNKMAGAEKDKKIIACIDGKPRFITYDPEKKELTEEAQKKKKIQEMPDKHPMKWYKLLISAIYLLIKLIAKAISALINKVSLTAAKNSLNKARRENARYERTKTIGQSMALTDKSIDNDLNKSNNLDNDLLKDDLILGNDVENDNKEFIIDTTSKEKDENIIDNNILNENNINEDIDNNIINTNNTKNESIDNNLNIDNIKNENIIEFRKPIEVPELKNEVLEEEIINNVNLKLIKESDKVIGNI